MKLFSIQKFMIIVIILALTGCATPNIEKDYELQTKNKTGLLVMSVTHNTKVVTLNYKNLSSSEEGAILTSTMKDRFDFKQPKGRLVVIELPVGEYELNQWVTEIDIYQFTSPLFSAPFSIKQGSILYIGNFDLKASLIHPFMKVEYEHTISDRYERDISLLFKKYNKLKIEKIDKNISKFTPIIIVKENITI